MTMIGSLFMISGIYVFQAVEEPVEGYCDFLLRQRLNYWFDSNNIEKISRLEYSHFENSGDLDLINRMDGSAGNAAVDLYENIMDLISGVIKIAGTFILLLNYNIIVSVVVVLLAVPIMFIASKYGKEIHAWYQKNSKSRRRLEYFSSVFTDRTTSLELKEYNHYEYLKSTLSEQFKDLRMKDFKLQMKAWKNTILSGLLLNLGIA
jgi:ATP-binding cassette subfamily B protein